MMEKKMQPWLHSFAPHTSLGLVLRSRYRGTEGWDTCSSSRQNYVTLKSLRPILGLQVVASSQREPFPGERLQKVQSQYPLPQLQLARKGKLIDLHQGRFAEAILPFVPAGRGAGCTSQITDAYSRMVRSVENLAIDAADWMLNAFHLALSLNT